MSLLQRFQRSLAKTRAAITSVFVSPNWDAGELERALLAADFGPGLATRIVEATRRRLELNPRATREEALAAARAEVEFLLTGKDAPAPRASHAPPTVILMVGVNGSGKTTTTAKLAARFKSEGGRVLLAAADTFRAAAIEQLGIWGTRLDVEVVATHYQADPASVAHDAIQRARAGGHTHVLVDTAGRQHTRGNLMQELQKIARVIAKTLPGAPHETWLVVDAPTGANALVQAREFHAAIGLSGIIVTKLDGSSKGGVVVAIRQALNLPIRFIGLGEAVEDLAPFDARLFARSILG